MKKIFLLIFIVLFNLQFTEARNIYEKKLPNNFKEECFKNSTSYFFGNKNDGKYIIEINKSNTIAVRGDYLVPIIPYEKLGKKNKYTTKSFSDINILNDDNLKTYKKIILDKEKVITISFKNKLKKDSFVFNFKHSAINYYPEVQISSDGQNFQLVRFDNLTDFNISKIKIIFKPIDKNNIKKELVKISELSFTKKEDLKLIKVEGGGKVDFYSDYNCLDYIDLNTIPVGFNIDKNTPKISINLKVNPNYNPGIENDNDLDGIKNSSDNCINIFNPEQKDSNSDGIGDKCDSKIINTSNNKHISNNNSNKSLEVKEDKLIESNKRIIIFIILLIIFIFALAIYLLIKKINYGEISNNGFTKNDFNKNKKHTKKTKKKKEKFLNGKSYTNAKKENIEIDL